MATLTLRRAAVTYSRGPKGMKAWQLLIATTIYLYDYKVTIFPMTPERYISLPFRLGGWGYPTCHHDDDDADDNHDDHDHDQDDDDDPSGPGKRWRLTVLLVSITIIIVRKYYIYIVYIHIFRVYIIYTYYNIYIIHEIYHTLILYIKVY